MVWATLPARPNRVGSVVTSAPGRGVPLALGAGRAQCSFQGSPQLPEAEAEGWLLWLAKPWLCCGANTQLLLEITQGWVWEQEGTETDPSSCPSTSCKGRGGAGRAEKPQNSLELRKTGPSCAPLLSAAPGSSAGAREG